MTAHLTSGGPGIPDDPIGVAVAEFVDELLGRATVHLEYTPAGSPPPAVAGEPGPTVLATACDDVLPGWCTTFTVRIDPDLPDVIPGAPLHPEPLSALPAAALRAAGRFRSSVDGESGTVTPTVHRALRDSVIVEFLDELHARTAKREGPAGLIGETLEYLIELSGTRVESQNVTHGVVIADVFEDEPRLSVPYPAGLRPAKRSPLLFDGRRSVLIVDPSGRARTELQRHRLERLLPGPAELAADDHPFVDSGSLVALATRRLGGIGFFLREDRSIWTFVDGRPLVIRRGEHWTAFPMWLATAVGEAIGGGHAVDLVVQSALMISVERSGAIFAIVDGPSAIDDVVPAKDRFDLRNEFDPPAMRPETRLHHLIDAADMDAQTLARLAALDGATIVDRHGALLAYGAIVSTTDSQHEGARTAAARTLSTRALAVLKVSEDGEITMFRDGAEVATLLRSGGVAVPM